MRACRRSRSCGSTGCDGSPSAGSPLRETDNLIPNWNDLVYREQRRAALRTLHSTNDFPEFTGRMCPAPCEAACTLNIDDNPVTIKTIECAIVDRGWQGTRTRRSSRPEWRLKLHTSSSREEARQHFHVAGRSCPLGDGLSRPSQGRHARPIACGTRPARQCARQHARLPHLAKLFAAGRRHAARPIARRLSDPRRPAMRRRRRRVPDGIEPAAALVRQTGDCRVLRSGAEPAGARRPAVQRQNGGRRLRGISLEASR